MIPGVPLGAKIVRIATESDPLKTHEFGMSINGKIRAWREGAWREGDIGGVVLAPDNPYGKFLHEVPAPEGRKKTGEYRNATDADEWIGQVTGDVCKGATDNPVLILKPRKRRVLVVSAELPISEDGSASDPRYPEVRIHDVAMVAAKWPDIYRIEERPA